MTNIVKKKLPHGAISFVNVKDANVKGVIMQLNENILSLKTQLETAQNALMEVQGGHVVTTSGGGSFTIKGYYNTYADLVASVTNPRAGDAYAVGTSAPYHVYVFDGNSQTWKDNGVITGIDGGYYTPSVSAAGNITWTASKDGMPSVAQQNIKGPPGDAGPGNSLSIGMVSRGTDAGATITGISPSQILNLTLPKGDKGDDGTAATVDVGTTTTGAAGSQASVINSGTSSAAVLDFVIPQGAPGEIPSDYDTVRANASSGASHAATTGSNPHGVTWDLLAGTKPTIPDGKFRTSFVLTQNYALNRVYHVFPMSAFVPDTEKNYSVDALFMCLLASVPSTVTKRYCFFNETWLEVEHKNGGQGSISKVVNGSGNLSFVNGATSNTATVGTAQWNVILKITETEDPVTVG